MTMIYLASQSPRRKALLRQINIDFRALHVTVDEAWQAGESPRDYVQRLALQKARAGWDLLAGEEKDMPVLGADTSVVIDEQVLGKPKDKQDALSMLSKLSARSHQVLTAVAIVTRQQPLTALSVTDVRFCAISDAEMKLYWETGEPRDKAGAYAIQGIGAIFVEHIVGSYSGVMGLPLFETAQLLARI